MSKKTLTLKIECEPGHFWGSMHLGDELITADGADESELIMEIRRQILLETDMVSEDYELKLIYQ